MTTLILLVIGGFALASIDKCFPDLPVTIIKPTTLVSTREELLTDSLFCSPIMFVASPSKEKKKK